MPTTESLGIPEIHEQDGRFVSRIWNSTTDNRKLKALETRFGPDAVRLANEAISQGKLTESREQIFKALVRVGQRTNNDVDEFNAQLDGVRAGAAISIQTVEARYQAQN